MEDDDGPFFDFLEAQSRALEAAAGYFAVANVPTDHLEEIAKRTTDATIKLAARVVLWQRRERDA